jgi:xylulokinase
MANQIVAGVDSSTQSVKIVIRKAETGELLRQGRAAHPDGTEVDPLHWKNAFDIAVKDAGGIDDVAAISIGGQQHGMVALDESGQVIRPALLWNDTRSATQADSLNSEVGGQESMAQAVGSVLVASFTASKIRWMAENEKSNADRVHTIALPHDWLSWQLQGGRDFSQLFTDRSDASGTGYFDPTTSTYRRDILARALLSDREILLPKIAEPSVFAGTTSQGIPLAAGAGDNAAAALGVQAEPGDVVISLGTSGTAFAVSTTPTHDASGAVAGFADATGRFLPLVCTLNAARIFDAATSILGKTHDEVGALALSTTPGAHGVFSGMTLTNSNPADIARAMIEGMLAGLADAVQSLIDLGVDVKRILIIGGAAKNPAVGHIASALFGRPVLIPPAGEYVADGTARQAAWALLATPSAPLWNLGKATLIHAEPTPHVLEQYRILRDATLHW